MLLKNLETLIAPEKFKNINCPEFLKTLIAQVFKNINFPRIFKILNTLEEFKNINCF